MAYNPVTRTSLLVTKWTEASLVVMELGDDGYPRDLNNVVLLTNWDGSIQDYWPSIAANSPKNSPASIWRNSTSRPADWIMTRTEPLMTKNTSLLAS